MINSLGKDFTEDLWEVQRSLSIWPVIKAQLEKYKIGQLHLILSEYEVKEQNSYSEPNAEIMIEEINTEITPSSSPTSSFSQFWDKVFKLSIKTARNEY